MVMGSDCLSDGWDVGEQRVKTYKVGGAVRDQLMGLDVRDVDWVVVGSTVEDMLAQGFIKVGADFPVFLHPETKEEFALARTERKTAPGYRGFVVHADRAVTLEEDLSRRDLTINAMAIAEGGELIDPHGGASDIRSRVLRHVSGAFREDPVRVLRLARFAARFGDFKVAAETMSLMKEMVSDGEVDSLVPERVWRELEKGLMEPAPWRMIEVLQECGALERVLPEVSKLNGVIQPILHHPELDTLKHVLLVLKEAAKANADLDVRFACLVHDLGKGLTAADKLPRHIGHEQTGVKLVEEVVARLKVPTEAAQLAILVCREHTNVHASAGLSGKAAMRLIERCDGIRRPTRFCRMLLACELDARGRLGLEDRPYPQRRRLEVALEAALATDAAGVAKRLLETKAAGVDIGAAVRSARSGQIDRAFRGMQMA